MQSIYLEPRVGRLDESQPASFRGMTIVSVVIALLLVLFLYAPAGRSETWPTPTPAPNAPIHGASFPQQADPWRGCLAVLTKSNTEAAPRSAIAGAITEQLLTEACFRG